MGRILALDLGEAKVGVAVSDPSGIIATPHSVIRKKTLIEVAQILRCLIDELQVSTVVVGVPKSLSGEVGMQEELTRRMAEELSKELGRELIFVDERFSSKEARSMIRMSGSKKNTSDDDAVAASIILENYLRAHHPIS